MGIRGIGAKPIKRPKHGVLHACNTRQRRHSWEAPDLSRAERVIRFVESLPCSAGPLAGTQFKLRPWQKKFIRAVYKTDKAGNRLVRTAVLSVGRANGKTTLASALALTHIAGPESKSRGEVYSAANDRWQAIPYLFRSVRHGGTCAVVIETGINPPAFEGARGHRQNRNGLCSIVT